MVVPLEFLDDFFPQFEQAGVFAVSPD